MYEETTNTKRVKIVVVSRNVAVDGVRGRGVDDPRKDLYKDVYGEIEVTIGATTRFPELRTES
jgi:hypothetical protein